MADIFALVDCNNFYVSCERVFAPYLENRISEKDLKEMTKEAKVLTDDFAPVNHMD